MSTTANILLVGKQGPGRQLSRRLGEADLVDCCPDPYEAMLKMGRRRWPAVALMAGYSDYPGLCRGARRLQAGSRLFGLCAPAEEPDVRPLVGDVLDDYFIFPPTAADLSQLRWAAGALTPNPGRASRSAPGVLAPREFNHLAEAARSLQSLESGVAELVSQRIGRPVYWADCEQIRVGTLPLLVTAGDHPRVLLRQHAGEPVDPQSEAFLSAVQQCLPALVANATRTESLHRLAITDHLTGTYNRRYFYHLTDRILAKVAEKRSVATLLLYDIDDFKHYNDAYGYAAGDEILRETASLMRQTSRTHDVVARIGGDEFAVLFWDAEEPRSPGSRPPETAYALADRFRQAVSQHHFHSLGPEATGALTISGGLASFPHDGRDCRALLREADRAIKAAKRVGKNAIQLVGRAL